MEHNWSITMNYTYNVLVVVERLVITFQSHHTEVNEGGKNHEKSHLH